MDDPRIRSCTQPNQGSNSISQENLGNDKNQKPPSSRSNQPSRSVCISDLGFLPARRSSIPSSLPLRQSQPSRSIIIVLVMSLLAEATPSALNSTGEPSRSVRRRLAAPDVRGARFTIESLDGLRERLVRDGWVRALGGAASSLADLDSAILGGLVLRRGAASLCHGLHLKHLAIVGVGGRGRLASQACLVLL